MIKVKEIEVEKTEAEKIASSICGVEGESLTRAVQLVAESLSGQGPRENVANSLDGIADAIHGCSWGVLPFNFVHELGRDGLYAIAKEIKHGLSDIAEAIREQKSK